MPGLIEVDQIAATSFQHREEVSVEIEKIDWLATMLMTLTMTMMKFDCATKTAGCSSALTSTVKSRLPV